MALAGGAAGVPARGINCDFAALAGVCVDAAGDGDVYGDVAVDGGSGGQAGDSAAGGAFLSRCLFVGAGEGGAGAELAAGGSDSLDDVFVYHDPGVFACGCFCGIAVGADVSVCYG